MKRIIIPVLILILLCELVCYAEDIEQEYAYMDGIARYRNAEGKLGLLKEPGIVLAAAEYDYIGFFDQNGLAPVCKTVNGEESWGMISRNGKKLIESDQFSYICEREHPGLGYSGQYGSYYAKGKNGEEYVVFADGTVSRFPDQEELNLTGLQAERNSDFYFINGSIFLYTDKGYRLFDKNFRLLSPETWSNCIPLSSGGGCVQKDGGLWGIVDSTGKPTVDYLYDWMISTDWGIIVKGQGSEKGQVGMISCEGKVLLPLQFEDIAVPSENRIAVLQDGKVGYMNPELEWVISPQWDGAEMFHNGLAVVYNRERKSVIDENGRTVLDLSNHELRVLRSVQIAVYDEEKKRLTLYDREGKMISEIQNVYFPNSIEEKSGLLAVYLDNGEDQPVAAVVNIDTGEVISKPEWKTIEPFENGYAIVNCGEEEEPKLGVIDADGKYIVKPEYSSISQTAGVFYADKEYEDSSDSFIFDTHGDILESMHYVGQSFG